MDPTPELHADVDVLERSPMLRGMVQALRHADENNEIGLTKFDAMNRKFVHWADWHERLTKDFGFIDTVGE